ncbi:MAG: sensor histidine kinase [Velocimicrobium sp.]
MKRSKRTIRFFNYIPLWAQLFILMTFVFSMMIVVILFNNYSRNRKTILNTEVITSNRLLALEIENLEQYISDLTYFSIQPCYDTKLSQILNSKKALNTWEKSYIKNQMRAYYYSRNDLTAYHMYLIQQGINFGRNQDDQKMSAHIDTSMQASNGFQISTKRNIAILPTSEDDTFLDFYYSIIRIKTRKPIAVINFTVDTTYVKSLIKNHQDNGEFICILNETNDLLYSGNKELIDSKSTTIFEDISKQFSSNYSTIALKDKTFIVTCSVSDLYHLKLLSFTPMTIIDTAINNAFRISLLMGLLVWIFSVLLITAIIRLTTIPLSTLANNLRGVGNGDFTSTVDIGGNREITNLSYDFNYMIQHIDELIKKNYLSEINEKTARLIALEAQLNPHFLYNTLQVISTEALINDQPRIHKMITSLASILRYTIKGGDFVSLQAEMDYVSHYILLQKMRLDDKLTVSIQLDANTLHLLIPKISIQTLVENSIQHAMGNKDNAIHITITSKIKDEYLTIIVDDDGCGIKADYLQTLKEEFSKTLISQGNTGIGLINLNSRLQLLYSNKAKLIINSKEDVYTSITLLIPAIEEVPYV